MQTFTPQQLRSTFKAGGITDVTVTADGDHFYVRVKARSGAGIMTKARSVQPRHFSTVAQALAALRRAGVTTGRFDLSGWQPRNPDTTPARPDRSAALKHAHKAAAHDRWFRGQVEQALAEADDPKTEWVSNEDAQADWADMRSKLMREAKGGAKV